MQTAQIKIGELYAIHYQHHGIVRFKVTEIKTVTVRRENAVKSAYTQNLISGTIDENDMSGSLAQRSVTVEPQALQGHYTEYAELKARQEAEQKAFEEKRAREQQTRQALVAKLYEFTGIEKKEGNKWSIDEGFFSESTGRIVIRGEQTIAKLLAVLEDLTK